ncbi:MAG: DinB family protein [Anaerolineae bacterium]|nr:DinB family protein [Anaerolineae bacterium]
MNSPQSKAEIVIALEASRDFVTDTLAKMSDDQFYSAAGPGWCAADYLKHLILSVKPTARVFEFPPEKLGERFGKADRPSLTYSQLVEKYQAALAMGIRAEDYPKVVPVNYNIPDDVQEERAYLVQTWQEANNRLVAALTTWSESNLDRYLIPHPALSDTTAREMAFFTIHHNRLHGLDIQKAGGLS